MNALFVFVCSCLHTDYEGTGEDFFKFIFSTNFKRKIFFFDGSIVHSTDNKIFNCQFCESTFRLYQELRTHEATHKRTLANINLKRCKICGIVCDNLLAHLKEHHEYFECDLCKRVYGRKNHLKLHMKTHIDAREYSCSICPKKFNFYSQVKRHERCHSTAFVLYCEICGAGFKNKPSLLRHKNSHSGRMSHY